MPLSSQVPPRIGGERARRWSHGDGEHRRDEQRGIPAGRRGDGHTAMLAIAATSNGGSGELFGTGKLVEPSSQQQAHAIGIGGCEKPWTASS